MEERPLKQRWREEPKVLRDATSASFIGIAHLSTFVGLGTLTLFSEKLHLPDASIAVISGAFLSEFALVQFAILNTILKIIRRNIQNL